MVQVDMVDELIMRCSSSAFATFQMRQLFVDVAFERLAGKGYRITCEPCSVLCVRQLFEGSAEGLIWVEIEKMKSSEVFTLKEGKLRLRTSVGSPRVNECSWAVTEVVMAKHQQPLEIRYARQPPKTPEKRVILHLVDSTYRGQSVTSPLLRSKLLGLPSTVQEDTIIREHALERVSRS